MNEDDLRVDMPLEEFRQRLDLETIYSGTVTNVPLTTVNVNRPGMQLFGYFEHFGSERIQVMGEMEMAYLRTISHLERVRAVEEFCKHDIPCVILTTSLEPIPELVDSVIKYNRVLLRSKLKTTLLMTELSIVLNEKLAPTQTMHGVLVDIYGVGVLMIGKSSIGKSETALELIQRNHRLVADDAVCIKRINDRLIGTSPPIIRHFMEVRGIGIIDVRSLYGSGAIKMTKSIELVASLEEWVEGKEYDRLGDESETYELLGIKIPKHTIPVKPGRNLAVILEVAARNFRLKSMGVDTLKELERRMNEENN